MKENKRKDVIDNFEVQFKKFTLPLMVLKILSERDMYAYEITQVAYSRSNGKYKMPILYTTIGKLHDQGFVEESKKEISDENRIRIYYRITDEGLAHLELLKEQYAQLTSMVQSILDN